MGSLEALDRTIKMILDIHAKPIEDFLDAHLLSYVGEIHPAYIKLFRENIEQIVSLKNKKDKLAIMINTPGGSVETTEKFVEIIRKHFKEVYFIVPDSAMSAGTIFCMSGDKIYMDYSSSLGPIDPQVFNGDHWVPALGYLDKVKELIDKSKADELSSAELVMLRSLDLAELRRYEQARDLSISLLKKWLVTYKFKNWNKHKTTVSLKGKSVTKNQKEKRSEEIAKLLSDNNLWFSHGRMIGIDTLKNILKLEIEDYSDQGDFRSRITIYNDLLIDYAQRSNMKFFIHINTTNTDQGGGNDEGKK